MRAYPGALGRPDLALLTLWLPLDYPPCVPRLRQDVRFSLEIHHYFESLLRYSGIFKKPHNFRETRVFPHFLNSAGFLLRVAASPSGRLRPQ